MKIESTIALLFIPCVTKFNDYSCFVKIAIFYHQKKSISVLFFFSQYENGGPSE